MGNRKIYDDMKLRVLVFAVISMFAGICSSSARDFKLLYWNIQNGMWSGQGDNYDSFVEWVRGQDPDVCVWCEAQSIWKTGEAVKMPVEDRYLIGHWGELAARYGHKYWAVSGHRDNYPQVITSKYPIEVVKQIVGEEPDSVVTHGAGWYRINRKGHTFNIVSLHTWPQAFAFRAADTQASKAENGGDRYRRMEIEYICRHTIGTDSDADKNLWMMMGDHNARSRVDNFEYGYPENDTRFLVHDYIRENTPYIDVVSERHPGQFITSIGGRARIDFIYCNKPLYDMVKSSEIISDAYTTPVRDPKGLSNFWIPSDHLPIFTVFRLKP